NLKHGHVKSSHSANLRNARPHQPTTKHSNFLNFHDCIPLESLVILSEAKNLCTLPSPANCIDPSRQNAPLRMTRVFLIRANPWQRTQLKLSTTIAIPCPPPMHAVASPYFFFRRRNSYSSVITNRVPVAPSGCPNALAPPREHVRVPREVQRGKGNERQRNVHGMNRAREQIHASKLPEAVHHNQNHQQRRGFLGEQRRLQTHQRQPQPEAPVPI